MSQENVTKVLTAQGKEFEVLSLLGYTAFTAKELRDIYTKLFNSPLRTGLSKRELFDQIRGTLLNEAHLNAMDKRFNKG